MISDATMDELVRALAEKTKANQVEWSLVGNRNYGVTLPVCKLRLRAADPHASTPGILVEVDTPDGLTIGAMEVKAGDPKYLEMQQLLDSAVQFERAT